MAPMELCGAPPALRRLSALLPWPGLTMAHSAVPLLMGTQVVSGRSVVTSNALVNIFIQPQLLTCPDESNEIIYPVSNPRLGVRNSFLNICMLCVH